MALKPWQEVRMQEVRIMLANGVVVAATGAGKSGARTPAEFVILSARRPTPELPDGWSVEQVSRHRWLARRAYVPGRIMPATIPAPTREEAIVAAARFEGGAHPEGH